MSANSLPGLPTELITQIFKSTKYLATATALGSTSRRFRSIWETNSASICNAILARSIICYDQALEYLKAQPLDTVSLEQTEDMGLVATKLITKIFENAHIASWAWERYEGELIDSVSRGGHDRSSPTEAPRMCFLQAWYRIHTLASLSRTNDPLLCSTLAAMDLLEFEQMTVILRWLLDLRNCTGNSLRAVEYQSWPYGVYKSPIPAQDWKDLEIRLESVNEDLHKSPLDTRPLKSKAEMDWRFMVHELYLDVKDSGKGVRLADLLPLNKGTGYPWPRV